VPHFTDITTVKIFEVISYRFIVVRFYISTKLFTKENCSDGGGDDGGDDDL
jgi:hypothetical protein